MKKIFCIFILCLFLLFPVHAESSDYELWQQKDEDEKWWTCYDMMLGYSAAMILATSLGLTEDYDKIVEVVRKIDSVIAKREMEFTDFLRHYVEIEFLKDPEAEMPVIFFWVLCRILEEAEGEWL